MSEPQLKSPTREEREKMKREKIESILRTQIAGITDEQIEVFFRLRSEKEEILKKASGETISEILSAIDAWGKKIESTYPDARTLAYYHVAIGSTPDALTVALGDKLLPEINELYATLSSLTQSQGVAA